MLCEQVYDINSTLFKFLEENDLIDQNDKEILKEFSKENYDKEDDKKKIRKLNKIITSFLIFLKRIIECKTYH